MALSTTSLRRFLSAISLIALLGLFSGCSQDGAGGGGTADFPDTGAAPPPPPATQDAAKAADPNAGSGSGMYDSTKGPMP